MSEKKKGGDDHLNFRKLKFYQISVGGVRHQLTSLTRKDLDSRRKWVGTFSYLSTGNVDLPLLLFKHQGQTAQLLDWQALGLLSLIWVLGGRALETMFAEMDS